MVYAVCVDRIKDGETIESYTLSDWHGNKVTLSSSEVKERIASGDLNVINLTLSSDNKLRVHKIDIFDKGFLRTSVESVKRKETTFTQESVSQFMCQNIGSDAYIWFPSGDVYYVKDSTLYWLNLGTQEIVTLFAGLSDCYELFVPGYLVVGDYIYFFISMGYQAAVVLLSFDTSTKEVSIKHLTSGLDFYRYAGYCGSDLNCGSFKAFIGFSEDTYPQYPGVHCPSFFVFVDPVTDGLFLFQLEDDISYSLAHALYKGKADARLDLRRQSKFKPRGTFSCSEDGTVLDFKLLGHTFRVNKRLGTRVVFKG